MLSFYTTSKKALFLSCLFSVFWSCTKDKENPPMAAENTKQMEETTPVGESEAIGETLFEHLKFANEQSETIWKGYDYSSFPKYFILQEDEDSEPQLGYLVDPGEEIEGADKIPDDKSHGLNVFRFDEKIKDANRQLGRGNKFFDFEYEIGSHNHYLQIFNEKEVAFGLTSEIAIHEVFHIFQFAEWELPDGFIQDFDNYPINSDLLPLQMLLTEIARKMPKEIDKDNIKKYLSMYIAIRSKEMALDPTEKELVRNMANPQETGEGTAKYVDYSFSSQLFSRMDSYAQFDDFKVITSKDHSRYFFGWGIWYETGAAVTYMLKQLGVPLEEELKTGKTLYEVAENLLNLSDEEKESFLAQAKTEFEFDSIIIPESERILAFEEDKSTSEESNSYKETKRSYELLHQKYHNNHE